MCGNFFDMKRLPMIIKEMLKEELAFSCQLREQYLQELARLPKGALIKKRIKGQIYYYLHYREGGKLHCPYLGKLDAKALAQYQRIAAERAQKRRWLQKLNAEIAFIEKALALES